MTAAEGDPLSATADMLFGALRCKKAFMRFRLVEGVGGHCEMFNRPLVNARMLDWLDEQMNAA